MKNERMAGSRVRAVGLIAISLLVTAGCMGAQAGDSASPTIAAREVPTVSPSVSGGRATDGSGTAPSDRRVSSPPPAVTVDDARHDVLALRAYADQRREALKEAASGAPDAEDVAGVTYRQGMALRDLVADVQSAGVEVTYLEWFVPGSSVHGGCPADDVDEVQREQPGARASFALGTGTYGRFQTLSEHANIWLVDSMTAGIDVHAGSRRRTPPNLYDEAVRFGELQP